MNGSFFFFFSTLLTSEEPRVLFLYQNTDVSDVSLREIRKYWHFSIWKKHSHSESKNLTSSEKRFNWFFTNRNLITFLSPPTFRQIPPWPPCSSLRLVMIFWISLVSQSERRRRAWREADRPNNVFLWMNERRLVILILYLDLLNEQLFFYSHVVIIIKVQVLNQKLFGFVKFCQYGFT